MYKQRAIALLGLLATLGFAPAASAETVIEKVTRTGVITMGGRVDIIPFSYLNDKKELVGYSQDVADLIAAEVSAYVGKPVAIQFQQVNNFSELLPEVENGQIDLACNTQFTWGRSMFVDYSVPYSLSGIRLLVKKGALKGTPESLVGKRVGVLPNSLGEAMIKVVQPQAVLVPITGIDEGIDDLIAGKVDAIAGDSNILAGNIQRVSGSDYHLAPDQPFARYAVGCIVPPDNSKFRSLVNIAIAKMLQGYVVGDAKYTAIVNKWLGPQGILELPPALIKDYFRMVLLNYEQVPIANSSKATK